MRPARRSISRRCCVCWRGGLAPSQTPTLSPPGTASCMAAFVALVTDEVLGYLETLTPFAPLHQVHNIAGMLAAREAWPDMRQVACFDTAFHRKHPFVNDVFALPRRFYDEGVRRYGFHGLSYEYMTEKLQQVAPLQAAGRVVVTHLGNGASMCAILNGRSIASSMGFTPLDGLPMGTRCGQLDPGVVLYLMQQKKMSAEAIADLLYREFGLKGLSRLSHDMRELKASDQPEAKQAIEYFVFRIQRELGGLTAASRGSTPWCFAAALGRMRGRCASACSKAWGGSASNWIASPTSGMNRSFRPRARACTCS